MAAFGEPLEYDPESGSWTASDAAVPVMTDGEPEPEPVAAGTPALDIARLRHESEWGGLS
jgi:hypothetical protein